MKKKYKIAAVCVGLLLLAGLGFFANAFLGNPVSKALARRTAERYLSENCGGTDYVIEELFFSFKDTGYCAQIRSPSSQDSYFTLYLGMDGRLRYDSYENVRSGANTARRLDGEYRELAERVLESPEFPYASELAFGELLFGDREVGADDTYTLDMGTLELDGDYDVARLGAEAGRLVFYADDEDVSVERAGEIMLDIKRAMEEGGAPFRTLDFVLRYPRVEAGGPRTGEGSICILNFPWADIYAEGMDERVRSAYDETMAYYEREDAKRAAW